MQLSSKVKVFIVIGPAVDQKLSKGVCLRPKGPGPNCAVDVVSIYAQEVYVDSPVVKHSTSKGELIIQRRFIHSLVILGNPRNYLFYYLLSNVLVSHRPKGRWQTSEKSESNSSLYVDPDAGLHLNSALGVSLNKRYFTYEAILRPQLDLEMYYSCSSTYV